MIHRWAGVVITFAFVLAGVLGLPDVASVSAREMCPTTTPQQNLNTVWRYMNAVNQRDHQAMGSLLHNDITHDLSRSGIAVKNDPGNQDEVQLAKNTGSVNFKVDDIFASDDKVAVRFTYEIAGDVVAGGKKGKTTQVSAISIARIECGQIREMWHEQDTVGMLLAVGARLP